MLQSYLSRITDVLPQLGALIDAPKFDPHSAKRVFRLSMSDYGTRVLLPDLVRSLRVIAPDIDLEVSQGSREALVFYCLSNLLRQPLSRRYFYLL